MHQQMKRRWVAQLGYTLFTLGIRILYQCPFFEKKYKRSSSLISLGLTKVGHWWTMDENGSLLHQIGDGEANPSHLINLINVAMSVIAIRILLSARYCFVTTREKFDSISAINLARATMVSIQSDAGAI